MAAFLLRFALPFNTMLLHLMLLLLWHLCLWVVLMRWGRWLRYLLSLLHGSFLFYLLLLYGLNWFSHLNWGSNVMFDFITHLPKQVISIAKTEQISLVLVVSLVLLLWGLLVVFSVCLINAVKRYFDTLVWKRKKWFVYSLIYSALVTVLVYLTYSRDDPREWVFEPLLSSIAINSSEFRNNKSKIEAYHDGLIEKEMMSALQGFEPQTNVILIIADALRADRLPLYGYDEDTTPYLDELQQQAGFQYVDYFTSTCSESICGIYSTLSSRQYAYIGFGLYDLSDVLKTAGYKKNYVLSSNHNYNALNKLYGSNFDYYVDGNDFKPPLTLHDDEGVVEQLQSMPDFSGVPGFFYVHLMSSHSLGKNKDEFNRFQPFIEHVPGFVGKQVTEQLEEKTQMLSNAYDNGILQLDDYLRRVLETLEQKGYLDDFVVIITGDHGDGIGERGYFFHTYNLFHEDINIPLIWYSSQCSLKNTRYGTQIDIAPTVLDCLGLPVPETWQGVSLMDAYQENRVTIHQTLREQKTVMAVLENKNHLYKLMADVRDGEMTRFRLYDYYNDRAEENNIIDVVDTKTLQLLKATLREHFENNL